MKQFYFKITVKSPVAAEAKIKAGFAENGVVVENGRFSGSGFAGRYAIAGNEVGITLTNKPLWVSLDRIVNDVKEFMEGV